MAEALGVLQRVISLLNIKILSKYLFAIGR